MRLFELVLCVTTTIGLFTVTFNSDFHFGTLGGALHTKIKAEEEEERLSHFPFKVKLLRPEFIDNSSDICNKQ